MVGGLEHFLCFHMLGMIINDPNNHRDISRIGFYYMPSGYLT